MDTPITRAEHEEFRRRMEAEQKRNSKRIELLEKQTEKITDLALSVKELAISVKSMAEEQHEQSEKLSKLEQRDGEMWRKVIGHAMTAIVGIIIGFVFQNIGF
jgi:hypothetical protein